MNEEERRIHKERRKRQKKRRKERLKEKAKEERIADRSRRIEKKVESILEERIKRGELERKSRTVNDGEAANVHRGQPKDPAKEKNGEMSGPSVVSGKRRAEKRPNKNQQGSVPQKKTRAAAPFMEISPSNLTITTKRLGAGSYGCCYLASYRGMDVVSKNLVVNEVGKETRGQAENRVREELVYEARIMKKLGDHPGVPLLFGVCSKCAPFRIIMQFHGDKRKYQSLTIFRALSDKAISDRVIWLKIVRRFAEALIHVHNMGFLHNDIKMNNVVLDLIEGAYNPIIIDFGKSLPMTGLRGPKVMSKGKQRKYFQDFPHIAPEIVTGKRGQSTKSDIYSFGKIVNSIFLKAELGPLPDVVSRTLEVDPDKRPELHEILKGIV